HHSEGAAALKPGVRPPEEPCLANGRSRQIELESSPPRPAPLRYDGLRGAGSRSQRCRRVTFQLCTNSDISTWLQQILLADSVAKLPKYRATNFRGKTKQATI